MVRDPVERVLSLYYHVLKYGEKKQYGLPPDLTIDQFLNDINLREVDNDQTRRLSGLEPPFGQCSRAMLERATDHLQRYFSIVGITERFDESFLLLKKRFGWRDDLYYLPRLVNTSKPRSSAMPPEAIEAITRRNEFDIELYEYAERLLDELVDRQNPEFRDELDQFRAGMAEHIAKYGVLPL
jgi:hypothetical protein